MEAKPRHRGITGHANINNGRKNHFPLTVGSGFLHDLAGNNFLNFFSPRHLIAIYEMTIIKFSGHWGSGRGWGRGWGRLGIGRGGPHSTFAASLGQSNLFYKAEIRKKRVPPICGSHSLCGVGVGYCICAGVWGRGFGWGCDSARCGGGCCD